MGLARQVTQQQVEEQVKYAFREFLLTGGLFGLRVNKKIIEVVWESFQESLGWRLKNLYEMSEEKLQE